MPFTVGHIARLGAAAQQFHQAAALQFSGLRHTGGFVKRRRQIKRGNRLHHQLPARHTRPARDHRHPQQVFIRRRAFEIQAVIAQQFTVIGGVNHQRVVGDTRGFERAHDAPDVVIDLRNHAVVVGGHFGQLRVGLMRHT